MEKDIKLSKKALPANLWVNRIFIKKKPDPPFPLLTPF